MPLVINDDGLATREAIELATRERAVALSTREWKHRLAGYGFAVRDAADGRHVLEKLPDRVEICVLPPELFAA